jgi:hypothetical protein
MGYRNEKNAKNGQAGSHLESGTEDFPDKRIGSGHRDDVAEKRN